MKFCRFFVLSVLVFGRAAARTTNRRSDFGLSVTQIIKKHNFPLEVYSKIKTEDNYLLDVYRIPHGRINTNGSKTPILLVHGLMGSSRDFVAMGPENGLAFVLAEQGYDVWLANCRGTLHSRQHTNLNPDTDSAYWTFSIHEIGVYDLPAMISLVLKVTSAQKLAYVGFSQGTTSFYILTSSKPEYNQKISIMASIAPVAYMENMFSPIFKFLANFEAIFTILAQVIPGFQELPSKSVKSFLVLANRLFCRKAGLFQEICASFMYISGGYSPSHINKQALATVYDGLGGSSIYQTLHYAQCVNSGQFKPFNWGPKINLQKYSSAQPPPYNISEIVTPVGLIYAENDWLTSSKDVQRLHEELPNPVYVHQVDSYEFNHFDMIFAADVNELVFKYLLVFLDLYGK